MTDSTDQKTDKPAKKNAPSTKTATAGKGQKKATNNKATARQSDPKAAARPADKPKVDSDEPMLTQRASQSAPQPSNEQVQQAPAPVVVKGSGKWV